MNRLEVRNLSVNLDGNRLLEDVSFELGAGERLVIIGPNGAGKTVLLKSLLDLIPHAGEIVWATDVRIGYVPQKIDADRHLPITYKDLFVSKCYVAGEPTKRIDEVIQNVGLSKKILETPVGHLSGGQFQLGLIAFALIGRPNVLILDEPTASVDEPGEEHIYSLIERLQHEYELSIIAVTHDMSFVYREATRVLCLNRRSICVGTPEAITPDVLAALYGESQSFYRHHHHADEHRPA
ncbi:MAG TPA: metal ABC transporter ATP-binding protein [Pyrinomonadaceae bacterium]|nr:metal ABC transporter ATP-binding protein [Pyrinomonadaceae bacterium]